ncbi:MAG: PH domain-containing protein [Acidimicrobiaceae bacterium]|nr:PH domain-containing protein [Acidimicrobiaceae bacterium]MBO0746802.1 PH domain-containing protein [Acidimicrobiaceae bacterium]
MAAVSDQRWHRLHPISPLVRAGRGLIPVVIVFVISLAQQRQANDTREYVDLAIVGVLLVAGAVSWYVTRWRLEGGVLRIDGGLIRRRSQRLPLSQIQAIDTVRPFLARLFGLSELRLRMAGSEAGSGRLAYLGEAEAEALRGRLVALAHGIAETTPPPPEQHLVTVATSRLLTSVLLSGLGLFSLAVLVALIALAALAPNIAGAVIGAGFTSLLALATASWRRFNGSYHLTVAEAADGLRLRSGLVQTGAETIPRGRVQAVRLVEPFLWRPLRWCRLEVDVAGKQQRRRRENESQSRPLRVLLPAGSPEEAAWLLARLFPGTPEQRLHPPSRARWKSPLRFPNLSWGMNATYVVSTSGRLQKVTNWVPLSKVQSVRWVEGPIQRRLRLASIHLDTAGRNVHAVLRDRDGVEAAGLMETLPTWSAAARAHETAVARGGR